MCLHNTKKEHVYETSIFSYAFLLKFEAHFVHYLETRHFSRAPTHILSSLKPSLFAMVLSPTCKQEKEN
jgi:hypothetical protein